MNENKRIDNPPAHSKLKHALNHEKKTIGIIFNIQICQLLNCSLPIEEILQVHGQNRPMVNLPGVDFRSQSREMPLIQHCCFELYFSITNYVMFVRIQTPVMKEKGSVWMN